MTDSIVSQPADILPLGMDDSVAAACVIQPRHRSENDNKSVGTRRVLHLINGEHYSGAERVQDLLALRLPEVGFQVGFVCVKPDLFPAQRQARDVSLVELPMRFKFDLRATWTLAKQIREGNYHLLHAHTPRTAMIGRIAAAIAHVPMVFHVHSPTSRDSTRWFQNWINAAVERMSLLGVARLITVSESLGRHMQRQGFARDRICVVPNGVPSSRSRRGPEAPAGEWTIGTVALFRPRKGTEVLLDAIAAVRQQGLPVRLRAVGPFETPDYEHDLKARLVRLGLEDVVQWTGFVQDVGAELANMDLFVLPSLFGEGLPMVVLEAMAAGVPVVATRVEGVPEAIRDTLEGVLAQPGDPDDLARAISSIIRGDISWPALRERALARHAEKFSDHSMAAGVAQVYRQVLTP